MDNSRKQLDFERAKGVIANHKSSGKTVVQCHGTFDLVHPGHVSHLEQAKTLGDILVVTVTSAIFVDKGPGRPYFNDHLRVKTLCALACVDYVVLIPFPAAIEAIYQISPDIYCKGSEYVNPKNHVGGNILDDVKAVAAIGGRMQYFSPVVFSSTKLLNKHFNVLPSQTRNFCSSLAERYTPDDFRGIIEGFKDIKVLLVGDTIFDAYSTVVVQGLTSKNRIMSARVVGENRQPGGALAVFRHLQQLTPNVKMVSLTGQEPWVESELSTYVKPDQDAIVRDSDFTTIVKLRYIEPVAEGKEISKLFCVNFIKESGPSPEVEQKLCDKINHYIDDVDMVLMMDFGHGVCTEKVRNLVQDKAKFLALNCQTNSYNYGFNIINHQYRRADSFSLDEVEMLLACGKRENVSFPDELKKLQNHLGASFGWLTRGATNTIGLSQEADCSALPFESNVVDTIGAGDAFCSLASLAAFRGLPVDIATFMGQLAGAQAVRIVGNSEPISKEKLIKAGMSLLNI